MLRGNYTARIDDKGRLKIPNAFRGLIEGQHGADVFVTSLTGEYVRVYPMPVWLALEEKMARVPSTHPMCSDAGHQATRAPGGVSPFGHPGITVRLSTPPGLSQIPTSFFGS